MITLTFAIICLCWGSVSLYFLWRFVQARIGPQRHWNLPSLVCAVAPIGWVVAPARELHWLPRAETTPLLALSFSIGFLAVLIILNFEAQAHRRK